MKALPIVAGALLVTSAVHYTDNWLSIEDYAPSSGLLADNPGLIPLSWLLYAVVAVVGIREYRRAPTTRAHVLLAIFSTSGIVSLGHLTYEGNSWATWQWASVLTDCVLGLLLLGLVLRSAARVRPATASTA
jgi:hypothetical protein